MKPNLIFGLLIAVLIIVCSSYAANSIFFDQRDKLLLDRQHELDKLKAANDENEKLKANSEKLEQDLVAAEQDYRRLNSVIPSEADLPQIMDWLRQRSFDRNVKLEHFELGGEKKLTGNMKELAIQCQVLGSYDSVARYLQEFSRYDRVLLVNGVHFIQEPKQDSSDSTMHATISFTAYLNDDHMKSGS